MLIKFLIFFSVDDVYAMTEKLEIAGCSFKKKPDEGRSEMDVIIFCFLGLSFASLVD
jgi:hypothetical protein